jgi:hypothetical protein
VSESYVDAVIGGAGGSRDDIQAARDRLCQNGIATETYRRLSLDEALGRL